MVDWNYENPAYCDTFWGSHGCSLKPGHEGPCQCITDFYNEDGEVIESSSEGNCAPPYFGPDTFFSSNHGTPTPPQTIAAATKGN